MSSKIKFFGKDLSAFITYSAATNQFINCTLKGTNNKPVLNFTKGRIQSKLETYYRDYMDEDAYHSLFTVVPDVYKYWEFKKGLFDNHRILYKETVEQDISTEILSFSKREFEAQLLAFLQRHFYPLNRTFTERYISNGSYIDEPYTRGQYFMSRIVHANNLVSRIDEYSLETRELIKAYVTLNFYRQKIINITQIGNRRGNTFKFVPPVPPVNFIEEDEAMEFITMYRNIINKDVFIANEVFDYKKSFTRTDDALKIIKSFYTYLINDFFITEDGHIYNNSRQSRIKIIIERELPNPQAVLNFYKEDDLAYPNTYFEGESKVQELKAITKSLEF